MERETGIKIIATLFVVFILVMILATRKDIEFENMLCENCPSVDSCEDMCGKMCLKNLRDEVTFEGKVVDAKVVCSCSCSSTIRRILFK